MQPKVNGSQRSGPALEGEPDLRRGDSPRDPGTNGEHVAAPVQGPGTTNGHHANGVRTNGRNGNGVHGAARLAPSVPGLPGAAPAPRGPGALTLEDLPGAPVAPGLADGGLADGGLADGIYVRWGKRALNLVLLLALLPFALALALPITLVNWSIFGHWRRILFRQPRVGRDGELFSIYKFRTMREAPAGAAFESWRDGRDGLRVTLFGRFLRNTHLDELPQLINVLRGEMDFIGPRPEMVEIDTWACRRIPRFRERNGLLPGITGLAQITHGYAGMDTEAYSQKLETDLRYLRDVSLRLDCEILARTAVWMLRGRGWRRALAPGEDSSPTPDSGAL